ncbi:lasso peptide biosynthesis B2 protein [Myceligenerans indicum]|nr:lasso peptide biosynthesis B2 protein [Myceligenerans indicum]
MTDPAQMIRTCVLGEAAIRIDYTTGSVQAATGATGRVWAADANVVVAQSPTLVFGTEEADLEPSALSVPRARDAIIAAVALVVVLAVRDIGPCSRSMRRIIRLLAVATRPASRPATTAHATRAVEAVRWVAHKVPARIACLEESVAAILVLTVRRRRATWSHGVAPDPVQFHAWIEVDDAPVAEPPSTSRFTALLTI